MRFKDLTAEQRRTIAAECAQIVGEKGDVLQFGGEGCAEAFNALAKGLALLSFSPGGVRFLGRHWRHKPTLDARRKA